MGSKGRIPPPHLRRPLPGPGLLHPDPFGPGIHPPPGAFPFEMLPPEIMDQKLAAQDADMQRLHSENQRIAATHSTLRQELATAQQELQKFQTHIGAIKANQEQEMRVILEKIAKMEAELQASDSVKMELQQARTEAQSLIAGRQEMISKIQQLTQDLHRSHSDSQQLPTLLSELESLKQEYQHCRATYDYDRKLRIDHSEQLQVMEKNYVSMVREVETLRTELSKASNLDKTGVPYASNAGYKETAPPVHQSAGQNVYEDGYGVSQGRGPTSGATQYGGSPAGPGHARAGYDASRGGGYDSSRNSSYDASRVASYDASRTAGYEAPRGRGAGYEAPRGAPLYDAAARGPGGNQPSISAGNTAAPYGTPMVQAPYGSSQGPAPYGSAQAPSPYGSAQAPAPYGTSSQTPTRAAAAAAAGGGGGGGSGSGGAGVYDGPRGGNASRR